MKDKLMAYEEPSLYIQRLFAASKNWWLIRGSDVGLIEKSMSELSNVTEQEA
jgi:hypothetical protein